MWFWIKNGLIALILLAAAIFLLLGEDIKFTGTPSKDEPNRAAQPVRQPIQQSTTQVEDKKLPVDNKDEAFSMTSSGAAKGLSNFYGKVRGELLGTNKTMGDGFVISVEPSIYTLDERLQRRGEMVNPGSPNFTGERISRRFRIGETIREQLAAAEVEGIALIWQLDRDYIIKHYFEVDSDLISALGTVASALDSDFEKDVFAFYCYKQRAVIIAHEKSEYVNNNCRLATTKKP
jgi:hypothetical protein